MLTFDFAWQGDVRKTLHYNDRVIDYESGIDAVQEIGVSPVVSFEVSFNSTKANLEEIERFYLLHRKSKRFIFNYDGDTYVCRFTSDWQSSETWGFNNEGRIVGSISVTLTMRNVDINQKYTDPWEHMILDTDRGVVIDCGNAQPSANELIEGGGA